jgi:hypothetical protein
MHQAITLYDQVLCNFERSYERKAFKKKWDCILELRHMPISIVTNRRRNCDQYTSSICVASMALTLNANVSHRDFDSKLGKITSELGNKQFRLGKEMDEISVDKSTFM